MRQSTPLWQVHAKRSTYYQAILDGLKASPDHFAALRSRLAPSLADVNPSISTPEDLLEAAERKADFTWGHLYNLGAELFTPPLSSLASVTLVTLSHPYSPLEIVEDLPEEMEVELGQEVTFTVTARGNPQVLRFQSICCMVALCCVGMLVFLLDRLDTG